MATPTDNEVRVSRGTASIPRLVEFAKMTRRTPGIGQPSPNRAFWVLDCHVTDAGEYSLDGHTWLTRTSGTVHLYAPGTRYWERSGPESLPFVETYFIFDTREALKLESLVASGNGFAHFTDEAKLLQEILTNLPTTSTHGDVYWRAQGVLLLVLDLMVSSMRIADGRYAVVPAVEKENTLAQRVDAYLRTHYHEGVTLDDIAKHANVSRSTLTHRYHERTGVTPIARLAQYRVDAARAMILRGERLKIVAMRTGFCDEYHLSKAFKRHVGCSPRAYLSSVGRQ